MWGVITSDRGQQFVSDLWIEMCKLMGIARNTTTSYNPQHNGKIERMHRYLKKTSLRSRLLGRPNRLAELPWVVLGLSAASILETGVSSSMLVTGQQPTLPGLLVVGRSNIDNASSFGESYLRQWQIGASLKTRGMTRICRKPVLLMICGQRSVF